MKRITNPSSGTDEGLTDEPEETLGSPETADLAPTAEPQENEGVNPAPPKEVSCPTSGGSPRTEYITDAINELRNKKDLCSPAGAPEWSTRAARPFRSVEPLILWRRGIHGKAGDEYHIVEGQRVVVFNNKHGDNYTYRVVGRYSSV
ncbi:MAG: hypothetical protein Q9215_000462 [Flavoplaca cf. flavocitrina]